MKNEKIIAQFIKFGFVGLINAVLSYIITNIGHYVLNLHEQIANAVAFITTVFISFDLNRNFVFKKEQTKIEEKDNYLKELFKVYASYSITGLFLTAILMVIEESIFGIPHYIASFINIIVCVPINFILNKLWAFKA